MPAKVMGMTSSPSRAASQMTGRTKGVTLPSPQTMVLYQWISEKTLGKSSERMARALRPFFSLCANR